MYTNLEYPILSLVLIHALYDKCLNLFANIALQIIIEYMKWTYNEKFMTKRRPNVWENGVIKNINTNYSTSWFAVSKMQ